jgi:hypothetical protein
MLLSYGTCYTTSTASGPVASPEICASEAGVKLPDINARSFLTSTLPTLLLGRQNGLGGLLLGTLPISGLLIGTSACVAGLRHRPGFSQAPPGDPTPACDCSGRLLRPDHAMAGPLTEYMMTLHHRMLKGASCRIDQRTG